MKYPGRLIEKGEADAKVVKAIQKRLQELGIGQLEGTGVFGAKTEQAVKLFQSRFTDSQGNPLTIDGKVGSITWEALFGPEKVPVVDAPKSKGLEAVLEFARQEIGSMEVPPGSNWGPKVQAYLGSVGIDFPASWCAALVYWCFAKATVGLGKTNPCYKTGGVLEHWNKTRGNKILAADAVSNPGLIKPGQIFIMSFGGGLGHTGFVEAVNGGFITTIEGNTNDGGSREGIGVFRRTRKIATINKGFIEYKL